MLRRAHLVDRGDIVAAALLCPLDGGEELGVDGLDGGATDGLNRTRHLTLINFVNHLEGRF